MQDEHLGRFLGPPLPAAVRTASWTGRRIAADQDARSSRPAAALHCAPSPAQSPRATALKITTARLDPQAPPSPRPPGIPFFSSALLRLPATTPGLEGRSLISTLRCQIMINPSSEPNMIGAWREDIRPSAREPARVFRRCHHAVLGFLG
ncbi:hypothetical protein FKP32DRAFT_662719 [Trametes sanguinea]|nr:hypothetical protein FKP32DRAFT_662719 [Trametes sanguinea]